MSGIILALDYPSAGRALDLVDLLAERVNFYKVGLELFAREGPAVVHHLRKRKKQVFLDLKLHDIPRTVAGAVAAASEIGARLVTVHTAGGAHMMEAAAEAVKDGTRLLGVTMLTSLGTSSLPRRADGARVTLEDHVLQLAGEASAAGLHGVVASPLEAAALRRRFGDGLLVVTPGIRLPQQSRHDQRRVATPRRACEAGADYLVIGRAVTGAPDPCAALDAVECDLAPAIRDSC